MSPWGKRFAIVAAAGLLAGSGQAATLDYSSFYVLGDSLTAEDPSYWDGRFPAGRTWAEVVAEDFADAGRDTQNFAWPGATTFADLGNQVDDLRDTSPGDRGSDPLVGIWFGKNDVISHNGAGFGEAGRQAADRVADTVAELSLDGFGNFVLIKQVDLGKLPRFTLNDTDRAAAMSKGAKQFNRRLDSRVEELRGDGVNVRVVDTYALLNAMIADPRAYGLRNLTVPCVQSGRPLCSPSKAERRGFYDDIHFNPVAQERVADAFRDALADPQSFAGLAAAGMSGSLRATPSPVPLPAPAGLLIASLASIGLVARRRASGRSPAAE